MNDDQSKTDSGPNDVIALSQYRARLGRGRRMRRADTLMALDDPEAAIQALPGDELYYLLREDDPREAKELLAYAKAEQIQIVLDFGLWSGDRLIPSRMTEWVEIMAEMSMETIEQWIRGIDIEMVALLLRKGARVYDLEIEDPPDEPEGTFFPTPDRLFVLDVTGYGPQSDPEDPEQNDPTDPEADAPEGMGAQALIHVVDMLYRADLNLARRILVGVKAELDSELEETALRWRQGRMADLGFIDAIEALEIYRELDPASVRIGELRPGTRMRPNTGDPDRGEQAPDLLRGPGILGEHLGGASLFARALGRVTAPAETEELHFALVALANRVLAADKVDPTDDRGVAERMLRMRATLDLAVEFLARGTGTGGGDRSIDDDRAVDAVRTVPIVRLFRLGVSLIGKVRALARTLRQRGPFATLKHLDLLEEPEASVLAAADRARPLYAALLDDPPAAGERPFGSLADIARATVAIQRAAVAQAMLLGLGVRPAHLLPEALAGVAPTDTAAIDTAVLARTALVLRLSAATEKKDATTSPHADFRPLTPLEVSRFMKAKPATKRTSTKTKDRPADDISTAGIENPVDALRARARQILDGVSPGGMGTAAREIADRWLDTLVPLETVLTHPTATTGKSRGAG
jgi:hypothetical protein